MDFFRAAARCDIGVVKHSPIPLDEKGIIEEELKARQWDTLGDRMEHEKTMRANVKRSELDRILERDQDDRLRKLRLEEKRKDATQKRELEQQASEEAAMRQSEAVEAKRLGSIEDKRRALEADREAARQKAAERAYEEVQRRLRTNTGPKSLEEQGSDLPEDLSSMTYIDRLRVEKERLGRMSELYNGKVSMNAIYGTEKPTVRKVTQLELDISASRQRERERRARAKEELEEEEDEDEEREMMQQRKMTASQQADHAEWLQKKQVEEVEEEQQRLAHQEAEMAKQRTRHKLDDIHGQVIQELVDDQEAQGLM